MRLLFLYDKNRSPTMLKRLLLSLLILTVLQAEKDPDSNILRKSI
jgi:hypothetical protein